MSDYNDFWFVDTRNQVKNLKRWFLWGILLFIFVSIGSYICMKSLYQPITVYEIQAELPEVKVEEAKKTNANGYIKGTVNNNTEAEISGKYIKFDFYTSNEINAGSEYIEIGILKPKETKTYEVKFQYSNIEKFIITITDSKE